MAVKVAERRRRSGVALLLVMVSLALLAAIMTEVSSSTRVDLRIAANARSRLQAMYLAQSAARLSLLRLELYKTVKNLQSQVQGLIPVSMIDQIWSAPLPVFPLPGMEELAWPGTITAKIEPESSKIPINWLDGNVHRGSSDTRATEARDALIALIAGLLETESFAEAYRFLEPEDIIAPLEDWITSSQDRRGGGRVDSEYERFDPPYGARNDRIPTLTELHMIEGWTDDLVEKLAPHLTVIGNSLDLNPNYIPLTRLQAMDPSLDGDDLMAIQKRRLEQPFRSLSELEEFITQSGEVRGGRNFTVADLDESTQESSFKIVAIGMVEDARRQIELGVSFQLQQQAARRGAQPGGGGQAGSGRGGQGANPPRLDRLEVLTVREGL